MSKQDTELVEKVARIARLNLTSEEVKKFSTQFKDIIKWFDELSKADTKGVKPSFHPLITENVFREDETEKCLTQEESLINTRHKEKGYFKGPRSV